MSTASCTCEPFCQDIWLSLITFPPPAWAAVLTRGLPGAVLAGVLGCYSAFNAPRRQCLVGFSVSVFGSIVEIAGYVGPLGLVGSVVGFKRA